MKVFIVEDIEKKNIFEVYGLQIINNKIKLLIDKFNNNNLEWIDLDKNLSVQDNNIPKNWVFLSKYIIKFDYTKLKFKNLFCPKWMIDDKYFLYNVYEHNKSAEQKFAMMKLVQLVDFSENILINYDEGSNINTLLNDFVLLYKNINFDYFIKNKILKKDIEKTIIDFYELCYDISMYKKDHNKTTKDEYGAISFLAKEIIKNLKPVLNNLNSLKPR